MLIVTIQTNAAFTFVYYNRIGLQGPVHCTDDEDAVHVAFDEDDCLERLKQVT